MATRDGTATAGKSRKSGAAGTARNDAGGYSPKAMKAAEKEIARGMQWAQKSLDCFDEAGKLLASAAPPGA